MFTLATLLGLYWITKIIIAIFDFMVMVGLASWYFSRRTSDGGSDFSLCRGLGWALRYNLGSLALGSFLLGFIWIIRTPFDYMNGKIQKARANS